MVPERFTDHSHVWTYVVESAQTVRVGFPVKITGIDSTNQIFKVQEATGDGDVAIGLALGAFGAAAYGGDGPFAAGAKVRVRHFFNTIELALAGSAGVTLGARVVNSSSGLVTAPATDLATGTTWYRSPGIALNTATSAQAFALAYLPEGFPG